jgi:transposase
MPIEKATLVEMYCNRGLTLEAMAAELGVSLMTVRRRMAEASISLRNEESRPGRGDQRRRPVEILTHRFLTDRYVRRGMTIEQITAETGFHHGTVRYYLHQAGIPVRERGFGPRYRIEPKELVELRRQGLSNKQIGQHYGCSKSTVEIALRRYGLTSH